jgi:hypothetical protein
MKAGHGPHSSRGSCALRVTAFSCAAGPATADTDAMVIAAASTPLANLVESMSRSF